MKTAAVLLALGAMLTIEQRDAHRSSHDSPSSAVSADGRFVAFTTYFTARAGRRRPFERRLRARQDQAAGHA